MLKENDNKILSLPSVLNQVRDFFDNNDIENVVAFIQTKDGVVHFLSTGYNINLLYYANKELTREMDSLIEDIFEAEEDLDQ